MSLRGRQRLARGRKAFSDSGWQARINLLRSVRVETRRRMGTVASDEWQEKRTEERSRSLRCGRDDTRRRKRKLEGRNSKMEIGNSKAGSQKQEVKSRKSKAGSQKQEVKSRKSKAGSQKQEVKSRKSKAGWRPEGRRYVSRTKVKSATTCFTSV